MTLNGVSLLCLPVTLEILSPVIMVKDGSQGPKTPCHSRNKKELPFSQVLRGKDCIIRVAYLSK